MKGSRINLASVILASSTNLALLIRLAARATANDSLFSFPLRASFAIFIASAIFPTLRFWLICNNRLIIDISHINTYNVLYCSTTQC